MEKIKCIELVFENCEVCTLLPNMFNWIYVDGIQQNLWIHSYKNQRREIESNKHCQKLSILINEIGLNRLTRMGANDIETLRTRLRKHKDITIIIIEYGYKKEEIYVPWNDEDEYINKYQTVEETKEGIKVVISKE